METEHKQIKIQYGEMAAEVDKGIAPLILEKRKADLMTFMSCENNGDEYKNLGDVIQRGSRLPGMYGHNCGRRVGR